MEPSLLIHLCVFSLAALVASGTVCNKFTCSSGTVRSNPSYKPVPNGCGTDAYTKILKRMVYPAIQPCCNNHDQCYDTCLADKRQCDQQFQQCMLRACSDSYSTSSRPPGSGNPLAGCIIQAQAGYSLLIMTCGPFESAQRNACMCGQGSPEVSGGPGQNATWAPLTSPSQPVV